MTWKKKRVNQEDSNCLSSSHAGENCLDGNLHSIPTVHKDLLPS